MMRAIKKIPSIVIEVIDFFRVILSCSLLLPLIPAQESHPMFLSLKFPLDDKLE